ncbi:HNH endonuclease family protein [Curtobacterium sp. MCPF17_050]|uniref:HNH endonuclease family protein n=1 Tax=Curtobacterium sp. MCPF17_050 TaxID=2175664 RepID=UPI000D94EC34|nr:HNH endonuclease family protein [Curtobacterium sp. MCPF17_050]WIB16653.1 HNH endonuclease family protein [Curtobacterium sp. MCPF17_050]
MTSRRRRTRTRTRTRTTVQSSIVTLVVALGIWALLSSGALASGTDAAAGGPTSIRTGTGSDSGTGTEPTIATTTRPTTGSTTSAPTADPAEASRPSSPASGDAGSTEAAAAARATLATLAVKGKAPATGYDREADFGTAWLDVDHNGCDTRNDVLARDLTDIVRQGPCKVMSGKLVSPYTGGEVAFVRGNTTSTLVQIDHVVALENAWRTGAQRLTQDEREALANDPENLFAVDGHSNAQKRSSDAATWLPAAKGFRCAYVEHQIAVKAEYRLWVVPAERDAMERVLSSC